MPSDPVAAFWSAFRSQNEIKSDAYTAFAFGDSPALADELLALVLSGRKRATASLHRDYGEGKELLPKVGDHAVILDGAGQPRCIMRTTEITVKPLNEVDAAFAWDEGEGDRSLEYWLQAHTAYFTRQAERESFEMSDGIETVFERFVVVWPLEIADHRETS